MIFLLNLLVILKELDRREIAEMKQFLHQINVLDNLMIAKPVLYFLIVYDRYLYDKQIIFKMAFIFCFADKY